MAFQVTRVDGESQGTINATWYNDFMQALTGVMNDQPIYLYYEPSSGSNPPTLKLQSNGNATLLQGLNAGGSQVFLLDSSGNLTHTGAKTWGGTLGGSNKNFIILSPTDSGTVVYDWYYDTSNDIGIWNANTSTTIFLLSSGGNLTIPGTLTAGAVSASNFYGYLNGNISGNANYANSAGSASSATNATNAANVTTIRNGSGTNVPIYTGTDTPSSPATGAIWIDA